ncbi:MAG: GGDEF domain-containing protein [Ruminococcus sp.]|nr:GGDEF domain-containing protein [Ruminococcus sp.]
MQFFTQLIHVDLISVIIILFLYVFMKSNSSYNTGISKYFEVALIFTTLLLISDNFDYYYSGLSSPHTAHRYFIAAGYTLRMASMMFSLFILIGGKVSRRTMELFTLPTLITALIMVTAPFHDYVFWLDDDNVLHREMLSYVPHVLSLVYFVAIAGVGISRLRHGFREEGLLLLVGITAIGISVVGEIVLKTRGIIVCVVLLTLTFYYLYIHISHFKRDTLTGAFNRLSFFADLKRFKTVGITAICEIDMNGLKQINDKEGHTEGDRAIMTIANTIQKNIPPHCYLYRLGGDEFIVLFTYYDMDAVNTVIDRIRLAMSHTKYSCAYGAAAWDDSKCFEDIYAAADKLMYEDKQRTKALLGTEAER